MADNQIVSEIKDKYNRDGVLGFTDLEDDIERILPGASESERNESRLNKIITGEKRPMSHTAKEAASWALADGTPFLVAWLKAVKIAGKGAKGLKTISEVGGDAAKGGIQAMQKVAEKQAKEAAEEAAKKVAENAPKKQAKTLLGRILQMAQQDAPDLIEKRAADADLKNVETAIKAMSSQPAGTDLPMESIKAYANNKGAKTLAALLGSEKLGRIIGKGMVDTGDYGKVKDLEGYDSSIEMGGLETLGHFLSGIFDLDTLNPDIYPMDKIDNVLNTVNKKTHQWNQTQLDRLGEDEKVKLVKNIAKGKYDTDEKTLSYELYKAYRDLTNNNEDNK